jgi:uncharacterized membrane protein YphA (DoxX/SURF4 family)
LTGGRFAAWLAVPVRWYLGVLFVGACLHKIAEPASFALDIATYDILPLAAINLLAVCLPWIELIAGVLLIAGWRIRGASVVIAGMMLVFLVALCIALARGLDMSCGCFASQGTEDDPISRMTVIRDLVWLGLCIFVIAFDRGLVGLDGWFGRKDP